MPQVYYPPDPTFPPYDPDAFILPSGQDAPVQFELVRPGTPFAVSTSSGLSQGWNATGIYGAPPGVTFPVYTPPGPLGSTLEDGITIVAFAGAMITHIDSVTATENQDGTGASFDLTDNTTIQHGANFYHEGEIPSGGVHFDAAGVLYSILMDLPDPPTVYVQSVRMTGYRQYQLLTSSSPPPEQPPSVTGGNTLDAANPGFTAELHRDVNYWDDQVEVFLGQRVNLTVESEGSRLGFNNRGHIITIVEMDMRAELSGGVKIELIDWTYTLEKIPGTLLPGAGTSNAVQDALGTGAEINLFAIISNDVPTIGVSGLG
jgi:hypothetical protein